jgi:hypothetical protein
MFPVVVREDGLPFRSAGARKTFWAARSINISSLRDEEHPLGKILSGKQELRALYHRFNKTVESIL